MSTTQVALTIYFTIGGLACYWFYKRGTYAQAPANYVALFLTWPVPLLGGLLYVIRYKRATKRIVRQQMQLGLTAAAARQEAATRLRDFR